MKKSKLFDIIVYRILFSIPVSCVANFIYGFILFIAIWVWTEPGGTSFVGDRYQIFVILISAAAIVPFLLFNTIRYLAIKRKYLSYGLIGLFISTIPEYLFYVGLMIFYYINDISYYQ